MLKRKVRSGEEEGEGTEEEELGSARAVPVESDEPIIKDQVYRSLYGKAVKDTLLMFEKVDKWRRLGSSIKQELDIHPEAIHPERGLISKDLMQYYFRPPFDRSPFACLHINRKENGEIVMPSAPSLDDWYFDTDWSLAKSQEYFKLFDVIRTYYENPEWNVDWREREEYFQSLAKEMKLSFLCPDDIAMCLGDVIDYRTQTRILQELDFYHFLVHDVFENVNDEELWGEVQEKFPLLDKNKLKWGMNLFYVSGKKRSPEELVTARTEIEWELLERRCKTTFIIKGITLCIEYYKLKHEKALQLGIIKSTKEGGYVDNYDVSLWNLS